MLTGSPIDLTITSAASLDDLKSNLRVRSLTDAFAPHEAQIILSSRLTHRTVVVV